MCGEEKASQLVSDDAVSVVRVLSADEKLEREGKLVAADGRL